MIFFFLMNGGDVVSIPILKDENEIYIYIGHSFANASGGGINPHLVKSTYIHIYKGRVGFRKTKKQKRISKQ